MANYFNIKAKTFQIEEIEKASKGDISTRIVHLHLNNQIFCGVHHVKEDKYVIILVNTNKENNRIRKLCGIKTKRKFNSLQGLKKNNR